MTNWWQIWPSFFSPETCKQIINDAKKITPTEATIGFGQKNHSDSNFRRSKLRWMNRVSQDWKWLWENLDHIIKTSNVNAFGFDISHFHEIQLTEYDAEYEGKYDWHEDLNWITQKPSHRKLSVVLQLSDPSDYTGGELEIDSRHGSKQDMEQFIPAGSVIVFPSFLSHRVTPVTQGVRYSLVTWCEGPRFK